MVLSTTAYTHARKNTQRMVTKKNRRRAYSDKQTNNIGSPEQTKSDNQIYISTKLVTNGSKHVIV